MNIALLAPGTNPSGNFTRAMRIQRHLQADGHKVVFINSDDEQSTRAALSTGQFDIAIGIHLLSAGKILIQTSIPFIIAIGGTDINVHAKNSASLALIKTVIQKARFCICPHQDGKDAAIALYREGAQKILIIPHGTEVFPSQYDVRSTLSLSADDHILFLPSGIRDVKDPLFAIPVLQKWHTEDPHVHLVIAGNPLDVHLTNQLQHITKTENGIHYLGTLSREDTHAAMQQADIVLNTSKSEGLSNALLEAMMLGTPILARGVTGNTSVIRHQENGFLFEDENELRTWAQWILTHDTSAIVAAAHNEIYNTYSLENERNAYQDLIQNTTKILDQPPL